jgi:hypothetical protein
MKIENSGTKGIYSLNINRSAEKLGTDSAFFFLWTRAALPTDFL